MTRILPDKFTFHILLIVFKLNEMCFLLRFGCEWTSKRIFIRRFGFEFADKVMGGFTTFLTHIFCHAFILLCSFHIVCVWSYAMQRCLLPAKLDDVARLNYQQSIIKSSQSFKPSWGKSRWLHAALTGTHHVQIVAPELPLWLSGKIRVRNRATMCRLKERGFENVQVFRIPVHQNQRHINNPNRD